MIRFIIGTRPEAIKIRPLALELVRRKMAFEIIGTGQHTDLMDGTGIKLRHSLQMPSSNDPLAYVKDVTEALSSRLTTRCDWIVVQGDTASALAGARYGVQMDIPVCHVEAGLRSHDKDDPWPEEMFRVEIDCVSSLLCCPTKENKENLFSELPHEQWHKSTRVTGNTVTDALRLSGVQRTHGQHVLVTLHRRESFGEPLRNILRGLKATAEAYPDTAFCWPVHPNPKVQFAMLDVPMPVNVLMRGPLPYAGFIEFVASAACILTDSGGVVEEACTLGVPTVVARAHTERPEAVEVGTAQLCGKSTDGVRHGMEWGLHAEVQPSEVFGDGHCAERIAELLG